MREIELLGIQPWDKVEYETLKRDNLKLKNQINELTGLDKMRSAMTHLKRMRAHLAKSGSGLSANEAIYLDDSQALIAVESAAQAMKTGLDSVLKIYQEAITEAEKVWQDGLRFARLIGTELSEFEIISTLASFGATHSSVVSEPTAFYEEKMAKAKHLRENFDSLAASITAGIDHIVQGDQELANQLRQM